MTTLRRVSEARSALTSLLVAALTLGGMTAIFDLRPAGAAPAPTFPWSTVANLGDVAPGGSSGATFNSFSQPSVNDAGVVAFRGRTSGSKPVRGVFTRATQGGPGQVISPIGVVGDLVPAPNNSGGTFNEFPSFPRIDTSTSNVVTRGQSTPVWTYTLNGTDTKVGTSGVYATVGNTFMTGVSILGSVPGEEVYQVPDTTAGTRFDQFPGSPAIDGHTIVFKGNYTDVTSGLGLTGVYFRDLSQATNPVRLIADSSTIIPGQANSGTVKFGSTAPPSAANGKAVFTGWDNEDAPTVGGVYLTDLSAPTNLTAIASIGNPVPGQGAATFTNFGEGVSFDGRFVGFWGSWGSETRSITLYCPTDGNVDLLAYCNQTYPNGFTTEVPVHQGIFVYDTQASSNPLNVVTTSGTRFSSFQYWVFSGSPPGTGSGDATLEPPRWRVSSFVAVSGLSGGDYQVAFKGTQVDGATGIYIGQGPSAQVRILTAVRTSEVSANVDSLAPGTASTVSSVGLERDGFRGRYLAITVSMLDPSTAESWAGEYLTTVPNNLPVLNQTITVATVPGAYAGDSYALAATTDSGLPVTYTIDGSTVAGVCSLIGSTVYYETLGSCVIDASVAGDAAYNATSTQITIAIVKRPQVITLPTLPPAYVGGYFDLNATSSSGLPVSYAIDGSTTAGVCVLVGATVHYDQVGACVINVNQSGDATYDAAVQLQRTVNVVEKPQSISVSTPPPVYIGSTFTLSATSTSGLAVTYSVSASSTAGSCTIAGSVVSFALPGTCVIDVDQVGDLVYAPAPTVHLSFTVLEWKAVALPPVVVPTTQVITTVTPPPATVYGTYTLSATTSSSLPVAYSIDTATTAGTCSLTGSTVSFTNVGTCVIDINQAGDTTYAAAPQVQQQIVVGAVTPSIAVTLSAASTAFGQVVRATASVSLPGATVAGHVQFTVDGTALGTAQPIVNGVATSAPLVNSSGRPLVPGAHQIGAVFVPSDKVKFNSASATVPRQVRKAGTKVSLVVHPRTITATVATVAPGVAKATGVVTFKLAGRVIGHKALVNRVATLKFVVKASQVRFVTATYGGSATVLGSSSVRAIKSST